MANKYKIDPSKIEGFDNLSADEKVAALLNQEIEVEQTEPADVTKLKTSLSKANSEAAEYKRQLREKQTEAERAEADRVEKEKQLQEELNGYKTRERISTYKAKLMAAGIDAATADSMANGLPEGVSDDYFTATKTFLDNQKQALMSEALDNQPGLSVGVPPQGKSAEDMETERLRRNIGL